MIEERLLRAMRHIEEHLDAPLSVDALAGVACISPYHFHRLFRLHTGEPLIEYVRRVRLEHAAYRLRATRRSVAAIAAEVGYESPEAFGRAFRTRFSMTPREYRNGFAEHSGEAPPSASLANLDAERGDEADVAIQRLSGWTMFCVRHSGPYQTVWQSWAWLAEWAAKNSMDTTAAARIGVSHDDPSLVAAERLRYDACLAFTGPALSRARSVAAHPVFIREMPTADYAITVHRGAYHELGKAYRRLFLNWLPKSGRYPAHAPVVERYRNSPREVSEPELISDILLPLAEDQA